MRKFFYFAFLLLCIASQAAALDIKGIQVDQPADCAFIQGLETRRGTFAQACENKKSIWLTEISFLQGSATMLVHQSAEGIVLAVQVLKFDFSDALDALTLKYGPPKLKRSTVQNRMGASFDQLEATWKDGDRTLYLQRHGSTVDAPVIFLTGKQFDAHADAKAKAKAAVGSKNL